MKQIQWRPLYTFTNQIFLHPLQKNHCSDLIVNYFYSCLYTIYYISISLNNSSFWIFLCVINGATCALLNTMYWISMLTCVGLHNSFSLQGDISLDFHSLTIIFFFCKLVFFPVFYLLQKMFYEHFVFLYIHAPISLKYILRME